MASDTTDPGYRAMLDLMREQEQLLRIRWEIIQAAYQQCWPQRRR